MIWIRKFCMLEFTGGCHCGNISVVYKTTISAKDTVPRACQCSFCRKHATRALSDPSGQLAITITDPARLGRLAAKRGFATPERVIDLTAAEAGEPQASGVLRQGPRPRSEPQASGVLR